MSFARRQPGLDRRSARYSGSGWASRKGPLKGGVERHRLDLPGLDFLKPPGCLPVPRFIDDEIALKACQHRDKNAPKTPPEVAAMGARERRLDSFRF